MPNVTGGTVKDWRNAPRNTGGGRYDRGERQLYFLASTPNVLKHALDVHDNLLVAVNELLDSKEDAGFQALFAEGRTRIFLDSGIYNLAMNHAKAHHLTLNEALSLAPEKVDGYAALEEKYIATVRRYEAQLWGYAELDIGGKDNKTRTRARLEAAGLRPFPVYHPINDGWDYFDELAQRYDRIAVGNVVHANGATRKRLFATVWERARRYPGLWIHWLGVTPSPWLVAYPSRSCDSSTWLYAIRWARAVDKCALATFGVQDPRLRHELGTAGGDAAGWFKAAQLCALRSHMTQQEWRAMLGYNEAVAQGNLTTRTR